MSPSRKRNLQLHKQISLLLWRIMPKAMKELYNHEKSKQTNRQMSNSR